MKYMGLPPMQYLDLGKQFVRLIPDDPSGEACYIKNPALWKLFREIEMLPEYVVGIKKPNEEPVCTEKSVIQKLDEFFKFPPNIE